MSNKLPQNLYSASEVRELDRIAIEDNNIPGSTLMARAAEAVFKVLTDKWPQAKKIAILCGVGNNAGDGFVLGRIAQPIGWQVTAILVGNPDDLKGDALEAYELLQGTKAKIKRYDHDDLAQYDLIIDAIFGSGLNRNVEGVFQNAIQNINSTNKPVIAIDIPSGVSSDTGRIMGSAVKADVTVSFIGLKRGLFTASGPDMAGDICFDDLSVPKEFYNAVKPEVTKLDLDSLLKNLNPRIKDSNKGNYGHTLILGGDHGMTGAVQMAGEAALRTGSGLVSVATRASHASSINSRRPEIMSSGIEIEDEAKLNKMFDRATVLALGPGLGQSSWAEYIFQKALQTELPLIIDADGLNLLAKNPIKKDNWILTPHPGEAARLLNCSSTDIQNDRFTAVRELKQKYDGVIVLKGCGSLIFDGAPPIGLCPYGNPGMASGGMGDVLTGIIAALVAQGLNLNQAAKLGTCLHAKAGDLAAKQGQRGLIATDLFTHLRSLINLKTY